MTPISLVSVRYKNTWTVFCGTASEIMTILTELLSLLTLFSLANYASAIVENRGLAIIERSIPDDARGHQSDTCLLTPLGSGQDDTDNVIAAISHCGVGGTTIFSPGSFNITRKMTWNLSSSTVELHGYLSFEPNIQYWLNSNSTYRVFFFQDQASWFVISGHDFVVDAFNTGGVQGNGQPWYNYYTSVARVSGDGRPIALTVYQAANAIIRNFRVESPPFWSNAIAESLNVTYDGMLVNATNTNMTFINHNVVHNTDGMDTYRVDNLKLYNWDVTCGDDCLAIKGNSTNVDVRNYTCRGGNGVAFGSIGQYPELWDTVQNVTMTDLHILRINKTLQPNMFYGVYMKSWDGTVRGSPPTGGGGGNGTLRNVTISSVVLDQVQTAVQIVQNFNASAGDTPSFFEFGDITYKNWTGTLSNNTVVDFECSSNAPCPNITFIDFNVTTPTGEDPIYICQNVVNENGLGAPCNSTGKA